jgi:hypothetical protein
MMAMTEFLIGIMYHEPEGFALWNRGVIEDYESSTGLFIQSEDSEEAIAWGEQVGEALLRYANGDESLDWKAHGHCWLEKSPRHSHWAHCLDFFQHVRVGQMPDLERMTTSAYIRWYEQRPDLPPYRPRTTLRRFIHAARKWAISMIRAR